MFFYIFRYLLQQSPLDLEPAALEGHEIPKTEAV